MIVHYGLNDVLGMMTICNEMLLLLELSDFVSKIPSPFPLGQCTEVLFVVSTVIPEYI